MIHAFFALKQHVPNARLHILGDTDDEEYRQECRALIEQLHIEDILHNHPSGDVTPSPEDKELTKRLAMLGGDDAALPDRPYHCRRFDFFIHLLSKLYEQYRW